jgi:NAD(P)-dependent dehydrogenase (short-subunit alcohol dehydrogenase family)
VIHAAGVIEDKLLVDKQPDSFDRVVDTKLAGAFALSRALRPQRLRFLVFFASVAGRFGNVGQADYGAANEALNKLALRLDASWPGRVVSINWGPWAGSGMASPTIQQRFTGRGIVPIQPRAGCQAFEDELRDGRKGDVEVVLGDGPWTVAAAAEGAAVSVAVSAPVCE